MARLPDSYGWSKAPIGHHLKGPHNKTLAHVWPGKDGLWRGLRIGEGEAILGPFQNEHQAMDAVVAKVVQ